MPDWNALIRKNLQGIQLGEDEQDEVFAELRSYLEDRFEEQLRKGISEAVALKTCLEEVNGLRGVKQTIEHVKCKETLMNRRTRTLWLPGFVSLAGASVLMMVLEFVFFFRNFMKVSDQFNYAYFIWLVLLPFCGAVGALLSRRGEGTTQARIAAGLFPSLTMLCVFLLVIPFDLLVRRNGYIITHPRAFLVTAVMWVLAPGLALFVGTVPFCRMGKPAKTVNA